MFNISKIDIQNNKANSELKRLQYVEKSAGLKEDHFTEELGKMKAEMVALRKERQVSV